MSICLDLAGQTAIVTGAARGLGQECAVRLADVGAGLVLVDRDAAGLVETKDLVLSRGVPVDVVIGDVTESTLPEQVFGAGQALGNRVDILVNAAGILRTSPVVDLSDDQWDQVMEVNATSVMRFCRAAGRAMSVDGGGGRIVNFASLSAHQAHANSAAYCASKAATLLLTKALATELGPRGITVNAVSPGWIDTPMTRPWQQENQLAVELVRYRIPVRRLGTPRDVADVVIFLCSPLAVYINGTTILIDGGFTAHYTTSVPEAIVT